MTKNNITPSHPPQAVALAVSWPTLCYYRDIFGHLSEGPAYYAKVRASGRNEPLSMFQASVYTSMAEVSRRMQEYGADMGGIGSGNYLGEFILNANVMSHGTIALGMDKASHAKTRPYLDASLWGDTKSWEKDDIKAAISEFFVGRDTIHVSDDITPLVLEILWNRWVGAEFPGADVEAFRDYQSTRLLLSILPTWTKWLMVSTVDNVNEMHSKFLSTLEKRVRLDANFEPEHDVGLIAWGLLDAITFAGGLGVPTLLHHCLAALVNDAAGTDFRLTAENVDGFIFEVSRLYPAVTGAVFTRNGTREILAIGEAQRDADVWGADAAEFRIRDIAYYHSNLMSFADFAGSRSCPGKSLSLAIIREFLLQLAEVGWTGPRDPVEVQGYTFGAFDMRLL